MPARVEGRWRSRLPDGGRSVEFELRQKFQQLSGSAKIAGRSIAIERATLRGTFVSFRVQDGKRTLRFNGHASVARISGQIGIGDRAYRWRATRSD